jgi:ribose transport system ATP-binding protein
MPLLGLSDVQKSFGATRALVGVDLEVDAGEVHALIGENGAGKSTLLNILGGAFPQDSGTLMFDGRPYVPKGPRDARLAGIAHIHQELSLCAHLTVGENIVMGMEPAEWGWLNKDKIRETATGLLRDFGCEHIRAEALVATLPVADRQVVEICRALASKARVILMDEPTSSLTRNNVERLFAAIRRLSEGGIAIIYISHFLEEVREVASRFTVLRDGKSVLGDELRGVGDAELITAMVGRSVEEIFAAHESQPANDASAAMKAEHVAAGPLLKDASFELRKGEVLGIGGLIGSGRTELVRALFGLSQAAGELTIAGKRVPFHQLTPSRQIRNGVGYLSEDRKGEGVCLQLSIADNMTITKMQPVATAGWVDAARQAKASAKVIQQLNVRTPGPETTVVKLSGGNQQKVALGRLLHQDPDVLLLDEPTRGIDIGSKADIYREIRLLADSGKSVLMVSSYLPELLGVCDRIAVMRRGVLSEAKPVAEWTAESIMQAAISGSNASEARN